MGDEFMITQFPWIIDGILLLVAFAWGTTYFGAKEILLVQSIPTFLVLRFGIAAILSILLFKNNFRWISFQYQKKGIYLGLLLTASIAIETWGITLTTASNAGVLISLTLIFAPLLESFRDPSLPLKRYLPAACLSIGGCALLLTGAIHSTYFY
jgi:drug/metabolite transporter (DMT)-like permease